MIQNSEFSKNNKYCLFGLIIHRGNSLRRGHYFSIVNRDKKWYECNDNSIVELNGFTQNGYIFFDKVDRDNMNRNGYLFFYRKIYSL